MQSSKTPFGNGPLRVMRCFLQAEEPEKLENDAGRGTGAGLAPVAFDHVHTISVAFVWVLKYEYAASHRSRVGCPLVAPAVVATELLGLAVVEATDGADEDAQAARLTEAAAARRGTTTARIRPRFRRLSNPSGQRTRTGTPALGNAIIALPWRRSVRLHWSRPKWTA